MMLLNCGRGTAVLMLGCALVACSSDKESKGENGSGGNELGSGGGDPGTGGAAGSGAGPGFHPDEPGAGGTLGGTGGGEPGTGGSESGTGGSGGEAGAGEAGAPGVGGEAGASACAETCDPCEENYAVAECGEGPCVCEPAENPNKEDHETLLACDMEEPCPDSTLEQNPIVGGGWQNGECLLAGLRDRDEGRYRFTAKFTDLGYSSISYVLVVDGSDQVLVAPTNQWSLAIGNVTRSQLPVERCTLKSYEDLEACLSAGTELPASTTGGDGEAVCDSLADWVDDCEVVGEVACPE